MRITNIAVKGLFGMFDHEIPLNQESRITIVHGPNGVGKTVLLRMVHGLFNFEYEYIGGIPFDSFVVEFDPPVMEFFGGTKIRVANVESHSRLLIGYSGLMQLGSDEDSLVPHGWEDDAVFAVRTNASDGKLSRLAYKVLGASYDYFEAGSNSYWLDFISLEEVFEEDLPLLENPQLRDLLLSVSDLLEKYPHIHNEVFGEMPDWFASIRQDFKSRLIDIHRMRSDSVDIAALEDYIINPDYDDDSPILTTFGTATWEVDSRIAAKLGRTHVNLERNVFANVLKDDLRTKPLHSERELFEEIINERLLFKSLEISDEEGISIVNENGDEVHHSNLSSGEQHLLILYYQLLFETEPDTLVMIDEPELSMNVVWQRNFLKDLQRIIELRKFDVLIATHSPEVIYDKWDWTVALGEKAND